MMLFMAGALQLRPVTPDVLPCGATLWFGCSAGHPVDATAGAFGRSVMIAGREQDHRSHAHRYRAYDAAHSEILQRGTSSQSRSLPADRRCNARRPAE